MSEGGWVIAAQIDASFNPLPNRVYVETLEIP